MQTAHIYFGNVIGPGYLDTETWTWYTGTTLQDVQYALADYRFCDIQQEYTPPAEIVLHFTKCYGGEVFEGYAIYNYLRGLAAQGVKIVTRIEGFCGSIGVLIALAGDEVLMADAAQLMVHKPTDGNGGDADDHRATADVLDKIQAQLVTIYTSRGTMDAPTAHALINSTTYLTCEECLTHGFVTGKIDQPLSLPEGATNKVLNFSRPPAKPTNMAITPAEKKSIVDDVLAGIKNFFKGPGAPTPAAPKPANSTKPAPKPTTKPRNEEVAPVNPENAGTATAFTLDNGTTIYADTTATTLEATDAVYEDEAMTTPLADGDYTLDNGDTFSVVDGLVDMVTASNSAENQEEPVTPGDAAPNAQNSAAAELARLRQQNAALKKRMQNQVPGGGNNPNKPGGQVFPNKTTGGGNSQLDQAAADLAQRRRHRGF